MEAGASREDQASVQQETEMEDLQTEVCPDILFFCPATACTKTHV